jgi:biopolymer transport protein ExbD
MDDQVRVRIADNDTIYVDERTLVGSAELVDAFRSALQQNPNVTLVIDPVQAEYYAGVAKVIYASQRAGVPVDNLRYATGND